jgi:hypothetical protein
MLKLEKEQDELISMLVEAARSKPRDQRRSFFANWPGSGYRGWKIRHPGIPGGEIMVHRGDITVLEREGLFAVSEKGTSNLTFDISPRGFEYYEEMKVHSGEATNRVETEVRNYLDAVGFQRRYKHTINGKMLNRSSGAVIPPTD